MRIITLILALNAGTVAFAPTVMAVEADSVRAQLLAAEESWRQAELHHDPATLSQLMADDLVLTETDGVFGKDDQVRFTADPENHFEVIETYDLHIQMQGNAAVVTGGLHERGSSHGKVFDHRGRFTDTWFLRRGRWRCVASHFSEPALD